MKSGEFPATSSAIPEIADLGLANPESDNFGINISESEQKVNKAMETFMDSKHITINLLFHDHYVTQELLDLILEVKSLNPDDICVVIGETNVEEVFAFINSSDEEISTHASSVLELLLNPTKGGGKKRIQFHKQGLLQIISWDIPIIGTDGTLSSYVEQKNPGIPSGILIGLLLLVLGTMASIPLIRIREFLKNKQMTRREFLKLSALTVTAFLFGHLLYSSIDTQQKYDLVVNSIADLENLFFDHELAALVSLVTELRNAVMALNTWNYINHLDSNESFQLLFYAGSGHYGVIKHLVEGPASAQRVVEEFLEKLFSNTLNQLIDSDINETEVALGMANYGAIFGDLHQQGASHSNSVSEKSINSAYTMFLTRLYQELNSCQEQLLLTDQEDQDYSQLERKFRILQRTIEYHTNLGLEVLVTKHMAVNKQYYENTLQTEPPLVSEVLTYPVRPTAQVEFPSQVWMVDHQQSYIQIGHIISRGRAFPLGRRVVQVGQTSTNERPELKVQDFYFNPNLGEQIIFETPLVAIPFENNPATTPQQSIMVTNLPDTPFNEPEQVGTNSFLYPVTSTTNDYATVLYVMAIKPDYDQTNIIGYVPFDYRK